MVLFYVIIKHKWKLLPMFLIVVFSLVFFWYLGEPKDFFEALFVSTASVFGILLFYLWEQEDSKNERIEDQYELLKNLVYDLNENQRHVMGLFDQFQKRIPKLEEQIIKIDDPHKTKLLSFVALLRSNREHNLNSFKLVRDFIDEIKNNNVNISIEPTRFIFNFHNDLLHSVFNNFKQFNLPEFINLRGKLVSLRHLYDVYKTSSSYITENDFPINEIETYSNGKTTKLAGRFYSKDKVVLFSLCSNNLYYFVYDFSVSTTDLLKEILKSKKMRKFYLKEEKNLSSLYELYRLE